MQKRPLNQELVFKYYHSQALNETPKLMGGAMKFFWKSYWALKYLDT